MRVSRYLTAALGFVLAGGICAAGAPINLQQIMISNVNPHALAFWDITNAAMDDQGEISAKKLTEDQWKKLLEIGLQLEKGGRVLATSDLLVAASLGAKLQDEGNPDASTAKDVQRYLDADRVTFRKYSLELQVAGGHIVSAVRKRDTQKLGEVSGSLDGVCERCHSAYWYPALKR